SAAMGLTSLDSMDEFVRANYRNYKHYQAALAACPGLRLLTYDEAERCNYQYIVVEVDERRTGISRDELIQVLHRENILARRYFYPGCHRMEPYRSYFPHAGLLLPETERKAAMVLSLPTGTAVGPEEIDAICEVLAFAVRHGSVLAEEVRDRALLPLSA